MKKIYLGLLSLAALFSSCDMDYTKPGTISTENGIESYEDCQSFANGIYSNLRSRTAGSYISLAEIQADKFVGTTAFGNRGGSMSVYGALAASDQDLTDMYYSLYTGINAVNFFVPKAEALLNTDKFTDLQKTEVEFLVGSAKFARAYYYWYLMNHFCPTYTEANKDTHALGCQLAFTYNPTGDRSAYPGRSTLAETKAAIEKDLDEAYTAIKNYEATNLKYVGPCAAMLNSYTVLALQARLALECGDYKTAAEKADLVIACPDFELADVDSYQAMWVDDESTELLFVPFGDKDESPAIPSTGYTWITNSDKNMSDYLPTGATLAAYDKDNDVRFASFFDLYELAIDGYTLKGYAFTKFPGNPALWTTTNNNGKNKPKPFRLSEVYLIAAEAYTQAPVKNETKALEYLNTLRTARIRDYNEAMLSGSELVNAIRDERAKELIGEGFRISDLRRWGLGFNRVDGFLAYGMDALLPIVQPNTNNVTYPTGCNYYVWPIPAEEIHVNPQIKGQQNPGY